MAKLPRKTQKIFCSKPTAENQTSVFGTMKTADKQYSTDVGTLQSNAAYEQGWKSATIASYKPFMEDFNTLNYINTSQLAYLFQQGIPEWDEATAYYKNSFCSYNGDLWQSLIDDNLGNAPFEGDEWTLFTSKNKGGGLELCDIGTALYVDETKGLRRILNGGILDITFNYKAFLTRLLKIKDTNPDYFTTEANWQAEKAMNIDGCVYKFVLNYDSTGTNVVSVRLPKYPDYIELNDLSTSPSVSVAGNDKPLRLTNGTTTGYLSGEFVNNGNNGSLYVSTAAPSLGSTASRVYMTGQAGVVTDASLSGLTGTINATTTKLKLIYFIQVATGQETENNIVNDIELNNPYSLFDSKYSDHELNNLSWLKSEGQWNAKAVYPTAYDELLREYNNPDRLATFNRDAFEVVGSPTITDDGVASGFTINSYLTIPAFTPGTKTWKINYRGSFKIIPGVQEYIYSFGIINNNALRGLRCFLNGDNGKLYLGLSFDGETITTITSSISLTRNIDYDIDVIFNGIKYTLLVDNIVVGELTSAETIYNNSTDYAYLGIYYFNKVMYGNLLGSIDLKQFSVTVDGKRVFSGAKSKVKLSTETYTDYDFVLNTAEETFRLPLKTKLASGKAVVGNGMTLGLTDGTLNVSPLQGGDDYVFSQSYYGKNLPYNTGSTVPSASRLPLGSGIGVTTDPTKSGIELSDSGLYLYFYVGETVQNANLIDAGRIGEQLANKQDKCIHIIDTYQNGTSGYVVWSNGLCDQWGFAQATTTASENVNINLFKSYIDTDYNFISSNQYKGNDSTSVGFRWSCAYEKKTTSTVTVAMLDSDKIYGRSWTARGYLAEGEY